MSQISQAAQKKILTPVDKSTRALDTAAKTLTDVVADLNVQSQALSKQIVEAAQDLEFKQSELDTLSTLAVTTAREQAAELALLVRENEATVLDSLLASRELIGIPATELVALKAELASVQKDVADQVTAAAKEATAKAAQEFNARNTATVAEHKVTIAQLNADSTADKRTIASLEEQVAQLRGDIAAERAVRVQTEQARAGAQGVIINTSK